MSVHARATSAAPRTHRLRDSYVDVMMDKALPEIFIGRVDARGRAPGGWLNRTVVTVASSIVALALH